MPLFFGQKKPCNQIIAGLKIDGKGKGVRGGILATQKKLVCDFWV